MGLDAVEFVLGIEEEFGISIADDEGVYFLTLGMVHDYLLERCEGREDDMGSTQHATNEFGCGTPAPRRRWRKRRLVTWVFGLLACLFLLVLGAYETWKWAAVPADAPVIGVSLDTTWHARAGLSTKNYEICLTLVGARILELRPGVGDPLQFLDRIDGLLLSGGGDVDPALYGGPAEMGQLVDRQRDDFEIALIRGALQRDMPILGICRGVQILNVAHGGTLRSLRHDSQLSARHSVGTSSFDAHQIAVFGKEARRKRRFLATIDFDSLPTEAAADRQGIPTATVR